MLVFFLAQCQPCGAKVWRERRFDAETFVFRGMNEGQFSRMKHLAWRDVVREFPQPLILASTVSLVADQRMSDMLEMHADLMGPTRVERRFDKGRKAQPFQNSV